jgi:hypothetical protein
MELPAGFPIRGTDASFVSEFFSGREAGATWPQCGHREDEELTIQRLGFLSWRGHGAYHTPRESALGTDPAVSKRKSAKPVPLNKHRTPPRIEALDEQAPLNLLAFAPKHVSTCPHRAVQDAIVWRAPSLDLAGSFFEIPTREESGTADRRLTRPVRNGVWQTVWDWVQTKSSTFRVPHSALIPNPDRG